VKILVDISLSPQWVEFLGEVGFEATHWSAVGRAEACDAEVLEFAAERGWVLFTHDLDFGALLAAKKAERPGVIQVRTLDILPSAISEMFVDTIRRSEAQLEAGALVVIDAASHALRVLEI
jgi:predicted nuclease of predicted toxin-antitoxin system